MSDRSEKTSNTEKNSITDREMLAFKAISEFIDDLNTLDGDRQRPLVLYNRLVAKTLLKNVDPIRKHIVAFRKFSVQNRTAIENKDYKSLIEKNVTYSERVYINMEIILKTVDKAESDAIWHHLLVISALLDPFSKAKSILKKVEDKSSGNKNFMEKAVGDITKAVEGMEVDNSNPMGAMMGLLASPMFSNLITGLQSGVEGGELDINSLMGTVSGMMGGMEKKGNDIEGKEPVAVKGSSEETSVTVVKETKK